MDVDTILASLAPVRPMDALERWEQENPNRAADFWRLIRGAKAKGVGIDRALEAWDANVDSEADRCPAKRDKVFKALRKREQTA